MDRDDYRSALGTVLEREVSMAHQLGEALAGEADALRTLDPVALDAATAAKQSCVDGLSALDSERRHLCANLGLSLDDHDFEQRLAAADSSGRLAGHWRRLRTLLETCREANQRNGTIVAAQRRQVVEALGLLRGVTSQAPTYDASGEIGESDGLHVHREI